VGRGTYPAPAGTYGDEPPEQWKWCTRAGPIMAVRDNGTYAISALHASPTTAGGCRSAHRYTSQQSADHCGPRRSRGTPRVAGHARAEAPPAT